MTQQTDVFLCFINNWSVDEEGPCGTGSDVKRGSEILEKEHF